MGTLKVSSRSAGSRGGHFETPSADSLVEGAERYLTGPSVKPVFRARPLNHCVGGALGQQPSAVAQQWVPAGQQPPAALMQQSSLRPQTTPLAPQQRWNAGL